MTDSTWNRTWDLFHAALELEPDQRAEFLQRECEDAALRREVEELLANAEPSGVLDRSPASIVSVPVAEGTRAGNYVIRERIGFGGMGVVYDAEQQSPVRRQVALKVLNQARSSDAAARFATERQALALMNHPHIARVFDAGVMEDGRPFLAIEYVAGVPLHHYCDRHLLTITERLRLFILVCRAIQHAHQKGIIHRDIKPSNVLVTVVDGVPMPKVIDFGVAKALTPIEDVDSARTSHGILIGTIEYMSPEQLDPADMDIDTRSDIYSLGAMLYECLTGLLPFDWAQIRKEGLNGLRKVARESEPPKASARFRSLDEVRAAEIARCRGTTPALLGRELNRDLDWVLAKALDRDRGRRYASASEMADDIARYLAHEPVVAGPPNTTYRVKKFVRRHRAAVAAALTMAVVLAGAAAMLTRQSVEIRRSAAHAERQRVRAERVSAMMLDIFQSADPFRGRSDVTAREVLDRSSERIAQAKSDEPEVKASVLHAIGRSYMQLRAYESAEKYMREALALRRNSHASDHLETAESLENLGRILLLRADIPAAGVALEQSTAMKSRLLDRDDPRRAEGLGYLASVRRNQGRFDEAEKYLREALRISRTDAVTANLHEEYGNLSIKKGDLDEAGRRYRAALEFRRRTGSEAGIAETASRIGTVDYERGDYVQAEVMLREALALLEKHLGPDHESLAVPLGTLGLALHFQSKWEEAASAYQRSLLLWRKRQGENHPNVMLTLNNLGLLAHDQGRLDEAERYFRQCLALQRSYYKKEHPDLALPMNNIARLLHEQGKFVEAERLYREALDMRRRLLKPGAPQVAETLGWLGKLLTEKNSLGEAETMLREAVAIRQKALRSDDWRVAEMRSLLGQNLAAQKRFAEAEPLLIEGYAMMEKKRGRTYRRTLQARDRVVSLYTAWGMPERAAKYRHSARENTD